MCNVSVLIRLFLITFIKIHNSQQLTLDGILYNTICIYPIWCIKNRIGNRIFEYLSLPKKMLIVECFAQGITIIIAKKN